MYAGRIVETGAGRASCCASRAMPTRAACSTRCRWPAMRAGRCVRSPGSRRPTGDLPAGCAFAPRCRFVDRRLPHGAAAAGRSRAAASVGLLPSCIAWRRRRAIMSAGCSAAHPRGDRSEQALRGAGARLLDCSRGKPRPRCMRALDGVSFEVRARRDARHRRRIRLRQIDPGALPRAAASSPSDGAHPLRRAGCAGACSGAERRRLSTAASRWSSRIPTARSIRA